MGCDPMVANDCSLRGAIIKANTTMGMDTIMVPAGTYTLTIDGDDDTAAMGDLDLTDSVTIIGAGQASTIIQAGMTSPVPGPCSDCIDRVFHIPSSGITAEFMDLTIRHGSAVGGGIFNQGGTVEITDSTLSNNSANNLGGGIFNSDDGTVEITNSTLSGNSASVNGGGIFNQDDSDTLTITNSTLSGNSAGGNGGGIYIGEEMTIKNSIVANSPSGGDCFKVSVSLLTALGQNFDTDGSCAALDSEFTQVPSTGPGGLNLGPLQNNGGPTETHALLAGSVAIDAATDCTEVDGLTAVTEDQRGVMRPIDGDGDSTADCDVGAYEAPGCSSNNPPTAFAGLNQIVDEGAEVTLDGTGSSDPDSDPLTFLWEQTAGPPVTLSDPTSAMPTFVAPAVSDGQCSSLVFQLTVTDPCGATATATTQVRVNDVLALQEEDCLRIFPCTGIWVWQRADGTLTGGVLTLTVGPTQITFQSQARGGVRLQGSVSLMGRTGQATLRDAQGQVLGRIQDSDIDDNGPCPVIAGTDSSLSER
jgi:predicted outer membrane repeat protein